MNERWADDFDFEERVVGEVQDQGKYWGITCDGLGFGFEKSLGARPYVGDTARFYPGGIGYAVRGLLLNGREVFYRTAAEERVHQLQQQEAREAAQRREFEQTGRAKLDADYATLPSEFKQRLDGFRARNTEFRWRHEGYEMFCCLEALKIAAALKDADRVSDFVGLPWEQQKALVPEISLDHSGNTFGMAARLAYWWLSKPENVTFEHGALCPLVGCVEYGCEQARRAAPEIGG